MNAMDRAMLNALHVNMGYRTGETVGIVMQQWAAHLGTERKEAFEAATALCGRMAEAFRSNGVDTTVVAYTPAEARNGVDASPDVYERCRGLDILFMPTVFSLTHTPFRKAMTTHRTRIASMPGFTLDMFEPGGPMDTDYRKLAAETRTIEETLAGCTRVRVTGPGTDMDVEVVPETAHASTGMLDAPGAFGNLPGAEAYVLPREGGDSRGHFTVPTGWGGPMPLPFPVTFRVENARFVAIEGADPEQQAWIDEHVKPLILGQENFNVFAELGIGTNPNLNEAYVKRHGWTILTAEKIAGSAHFANGNNAGFGGTNNVPVHIDWVIPGVRIAYE